MKEKQHLIRAAAEAMRRFDLLPQSQKVARLKHIGILSPDGQLSERYGGPGKP